MYFSHKKIPIESVMSDGSHPGMNLIASEESFMSKRRMRFCGSRTSHLISCLSENNKEKRDGRPRKGR